MAGIRRRYFLYLCPACGDQSQFAGFCDSCGTRLTPHAAIPLATLHEHFEGYVAGASPADRDSIGAYVDSLLDSCGLLAG